MITTNGLKKLSEVFKAVYQFGNKFVELAETAAVGRALADAGFGLQFADTEGDLDPEVTDAPLDPNLMVGSLYFKMKLKRYLLFDFFIATFFCVLKNELYLLVIFTTLCMIVITMVIGKCNNFMNKK